MRPIWATYMKKHLAVQSWVERYLWDCHMARRMSRHFPRFFSYHSRNVVVTSTISNSVCILIFQMFVTDANLHLSNLCLSFGELNIRTLLLDCKFKPIPNLWSNIMPLIFVAYIFGRAIFCLGLKNLLQSVFFDTHWRTEQSSFLVFHEFFKRGQLGILRLFLGRNIFFLLRCNFNQGDSELWRTLVEAIRAWGLITHLIY